ncbi:unnamed protein product [Clavelina lepadiformis]|uniref:VWFD domain-containing protein n=1 Tax=Clavelina lepadiformis TaxID=159417 RepID=A0ABP0G579_CLALP
MKIDKVKVNLPYVNEGRQIDVRYNGRFVRLSTSLDLNLEYDGDSYLTVEVSNEFIGKGEGLCGNYTGSTNDQLRERNDKVIKAPDFGNAFQISSAKKCASLPPPTGEDSCQHIDGRRFHYICHNILELHECFSKCRTKVNASRFREDCVSDACTYDDQVTALEINVGAYAKTCQEFGVEICDWRAIIKTPLLCPANSHYSLCTPSCSATCATSHMTSSCDKPCLEGCECDEGFMLSGTSCVPKEECGCLYQGDDYYLANETFFRNNCSSKCLCQEREVKCSIFSCQSGETCGRDIDGRIACVPTGRGICRVTMVQATNKDHGTNTRVSRLDYVTVELPDNVVKMHQYSTTLNGETIHGYHSALFKIRLTGRSVYLMTQHGLLVTVDKDRITIQLPSSYMNEVHGFCGNFNQNPDDDFETELNILAFDWNKFARSYLVGDCTRKDPAPARSECPDLESQKWSGSQYCGLLTNPSGVFAPCHKSVDPEHYFQSCVFNLCATDVETLLLEKVLKNYAAVCQEHDVALCDWRNKTSTVRLNCLSNSHYVGCASPCPDTCSDPFASAE